MLATQQDREKLSLCGENYFIHYSQVRYVLSTVVPEDLDRWF
jgi:hypothetical protein